MLFPLLLVGIFHIVYSLSTAGSVILVEVPFLVEPCSNLVFINGNRGDCFQSLFIKKINLVLGSLLFPQKGKLLIGCII